MSTHTSPVEGTEAPIKVGDIISLTTTEGRLRGLVTDVTATGGGTRVQINVSGEIHIYGIDGMNYSIDTERHSHPFPVTTADDVPEMVADLGDGYAVAIYSHTDCTDSGTPYAVHAVYADVEVTEDDPEDRIGGRIAYSLTGEDVTGNRVTFLTDVSGNTMVRRIG